MRAHEQYTFGMVGGTTIGVTNLGMGVTVGSRRTASATPADVAAMAKATAADMAVCVPHRAILLGCVSRA